MRIKRSSGCVLSVIFGLTCVSPIHAETEPGVIARKVLSGDSTLAAESVAELRNLGPAGLDALFETFYQLIKSHGSEPLAGSDPEWQRLTAALDAVSQQRDSFASHLYWYTDIERAKAAARSSGRPILSLRLLGNLNEEFSCANSRFFRSILYANEQVSAYLRTHFVLHWKSVRPAPRVTIDFGDGRKIESTLTGNSIHYVLDTEGQPVDAIPGLYGPAAFLRQLLLAEGAFKLALGKTGADREATLKQYHKSRRETISAELRSDMARAGVTASEIQVPGSPGPVGALDRSTAVGPSAVGPGGAAAQQTPTALRAAPLAMSKSIVETKPLRSIGEGARVPTSAPSETESVAWQKIAALHSSDSKLDESSIALIRSQYTTTEPLARGGIARIVRNVERYASLDTVRNEYMMHSKLHEWLAETSAGQDIETLNEQVYAKLFLTPGSDPWLGLLSPDTYTGLENGGVTKK